MLRRTLLTGLAAWPLLGDVRAEIRAVFGELSTALSGGDAQDFLSYFDSSMPAWDEFQNNVTALVEQNEVLTSIDLLDQQIGETEARVELDWLLQIRSRQRTGPVTRRDEKVTCRLARRKKKWKIVELKPLSLFAPPRPGLG